MSHQGAQTSISRIYIPLMVQNESAWREAVARGQKLFNEAAFDRGQALYSGELDGQPFRAVVKTFQVASWQSLRRQWQELDEPVRHRLSELLGADSAVSLGAPLA